MIKTIEELAKELDFDVINPKKEDLERLKEWVVVNVSQDAVTLSQEDPGAFKKHLDLAKNYFRLLEQDGNDLTAPISALEGYTPLQFAALHGFHYFIQIQERINPEALNDKSVIKYSQPPLHLAAAQGHVNTINALLEAGANPTIRNGQKKTAAHCALQLNLNQDHKKEKEAIFEKFLQVSPEIIELLDESGESVLYPAAVHGFNNMVFELLRRNEALAKAKNTHGKGAIHSAILNGGDEKVDLIKIFLNVPGLLDLTDGKGQKAIHYAAMYGKKELMALFNEQNEAQLNCPDDEGRTPFILAVTNGNFEALSVLAANPRVNPGCVDRQGATALHLAVGTQNKDMIDWLLKNTKIDVNQENQQGSTPYDLAENTSTLKEILEAHGGHSGHSPRFSK